MSCDSDAARRLTLRLVNNLQRTIAYKGSKERPGVGADRADPDSSRPGPSRLEREPRGGLMPL